MAAQLAPGSGSKGKNVAGSEVVGMGQNEGRRGCTGSLGARGAQALLSGEGQSHRFVTVMLQ